MPLTIAIDVDEVLAAFIPGLCDFHNEAYGTSLTPADFKSYRFCEQREIASEATQVWGGDDAAAIDKVHAFFESRHFADLAEIRGAREGLAALRARGHDLVVVTSRQLAIEHVTRDWLARHFGADMFRDIQFGNTWGVSGRKITKAELCGRVGATVLVDDADSYAAQVAEAGIDALLFDLDGAYAWNKTPVEIDNARIARVRGWPDVVAAIDAMDKAA